MAAVRHGGDRQQLHEQIRQHSHAVTSKIKAGGSNDLIERLQNDPAFRSIDFSKALDPRAYVGRAPEQVEEFLHEHVEPALKSYSGGSLLSAEIPV
jgi:adenylosuccinate lyase